LHDLRRTASTMMVRKPLSVEPKIIDLVLHHMPAKLDELRAIYMLEEKRRRDARRVRALGCGAAQGARSGTPAG
jgi:hypothetical protein